MLKILVLIAALLSSYSSAVAQTPFYQGKTVTVVSSNAASSGTGNLRVNVLLPYLRKHIPGNPTLVVEHMDGGGGRKAANYLYRTARPDGLTIGAMGGSVLSLHIMGDSGVLYDIDKFIYLGAPESASHQIFYTRKELGLSNLEKLRSRPGVRIGAQSVGHPSYTGARMFAYLLELKEPAVVAGYSATEIDAALLRGELDARANLAVSVLRRNADWLDKGVMEFHAVMESPKGN